MATLIQSMQHCRRALFVGDDDGRKDVNLHRLIDP